jgi:hypothetical protein
VSQHTQATPLHAIHPVSTQFSPQGFILKSGQQGRNGRPVGRAGAKAVIPSLTSVEERDTAGFSLSPLNGWRLVSCVLFREFFASINNEAAKHRSLAYVEYVGELWHGESGFSKLPCTIEPSFGGPPLSSATKMWLLLPPIEFIVLQPSC